MSETKVEQRTATIAVENVRTEGKRLSGFAALYNAESRDLGGFTETILPGAFGDVLAGSPDVYLTFNHSPDKILARTTSGTLRLRDEERGLAFEADLGDGPTAQDVRDMVQRGDLSGASFRFVVAPDGERWEGERRTLTRIAELIDLSLATTPAYDGPKVELRTKPPNQKEKTAMDESSTNEQEVEDAVVDDDAETETRSNGGGLRVEDRAGDGGASSEERVMHELGEALRQVEKGEMRALTGSISLAPTAVAATLFDRLRARAIMFRAGIRVLDMPNADSVVYPSITADVAPIFYSEGGTITPGDPTFSSITATPRKLAHLIQVSNEVLDDSTPPLQQVLNDHLLTVLGVKLDAMMLEGDGSAPNIRGLKNVAGIQTSVAGVNGASATLDMFADGLALLEAVNIPPENIVIVTHPRTVAALRKLKASTAGSYLWGDPTTATPRPIFGEQVFTSSQLSVTETQGSSSVTNSAYLLDKTQVIWVRRQDPQVVLDRSRLFNSDQSELRATLRGDLIVPNPTAIVRITGLLP
jgi:HK97 family phage major capsid protein